MTSFLSKIENNKKNKALEKIAFGEFESARGTYHLKMLKDAQTRFQSIVKDYNLEILESNDQIREIEDNTKKQLSQCLERYLISTKITEIPGIGAALGQRILKFIYKNTLTDLYRSFALNGIGDQKQLQINIWVHKYLEEIPGLLLKDFPGKEEIIIQSNDKIYTIQEQIKQKISEKSMVEKKLEMINFWINKLEKTTLNDFITARVENKGNFSEIEEYINGVFAEWEPIPDWFKEVISGETNVQ
ncbi:MAG: hypothetical protein GYA45_07690 [Pelolinea sp.]|jgi:hypothetical protein|nr:hypothetical protein [Pelolinea sp.]